MPLSKQNTRLHLHFEQWYSSGPGAHEIAVEISSWSGDSWGDWRLLAHLTRQVSDGARRRVLLDLTEYAGQRIRLGFYAATKAVDGVGARDESAEPQMSQMPREAFWIVTEVALREQETPQHVPAKEEVFVQTVGQAESTQVYFEDFEGGWGDWSASNGIWQVGTLTTGPGSCHGGSQCAATVLDGNYPQYTDSRLISPPLDLPLLAAGDALFLRFWQWYSYADDDGQIQISTWDGAQWGDWVSLQTVDGSADWHLSTLDLTAYTGERVRLGFLHRAGYFTSAGWFIDDITLSQFTASTIPIGESTSGSFDGEGDRQYFAVEVPPDGHLYIRLNILDGLGIYEAYVRCGALPTLGEYDYSFTVEDGEGELLIPNAPPGTCYVMLYADSLAGGSGDYELQVDFNTGVFITSVTPESVGNAVPATFILEGAGFSPSSTVSLVNGGTTVPADGLFFVSAARLEAEVDVTTLALWLSALQLRSEPQYIVLFVSRQPCT